MLKRKGVAMEQQQLSEALKHAMLAERDGHQFYTMAATKTELPEARELFEHLATEEKKHFDALQDRYRNVLEGAAWEAATAWGNPWKPQDASALFSDQFRVRIQGKHHEMAALSIGILLEKEAFQFYDTQADAADRPEMRAFFAELAEWERGHHAILLKLDEMTKEAYWEENRFSPLL